MKLIKVLKRNQILVASIFLLLLSLQLISEKMRGEGGDKIIERLTFSIAAIIQKPLSSASQGLKDIWTGYIYLVGLREENELLKKKVAALNEENNRFREFSLENDRLKKYLQIVETSPYSLIVARLIGIESTGWYETVIIDKGKDDGLVKDMAVVTPQGIVGRILKVFPKASQVLIILDNNSSIDALVQRSRVRGIASGTGDSSLTLRFVSKEDDIAVGDRVVSSGLGGIFPKGVMIGEIMRIKDKKGGFFKYVELKPTVDFSKLEEVLVIKDIS